jgi:hypothetical protein
MTGTEGVSVVGELSDGSVVETPLEHALGKTGVLIVAGFIGARWRTLQWDLCLTEKSR